MAAQLRDDGYDSGLKLVCPEDFEKMVQACDNPPRPSDKLVQMFADRKAASNKD